MHVQTWNDIDKQDVKNRMNNYEWNSDEVYWFLFSLVLVTRIECAHEITVVALSSHGLWPQNLHSHSFLWNFVAPPIYLSLYQNMMAFFITVKKKQKNRFLFVILSFILCDQSGDIELKPFNSGRLSCRTSIPYTQS